MRCETSLTKRSKVIQRLRENPALYWYKVKTRISLNRTQDGLLLECGHVSRPFPAHEERDETVQCECDKCFMELAKNLEQMGEPEFYREGKGIKDHADAK